MTVSRDWERVNQLFHEALALAPDARAAFVKTRAGDAHVFDEVMSLLQTCSAAEGFLSTPPDSAQVRAVLARLQTGDELGPFRITSLIGAGGMGEVYRAWTRGSTARWRSQCCRKSPRSMMPAVSGSRPKPGRSPA